VSSNIERINHVPPPVVSAPSQEEEEVLHASIRAGSIAQIVVATVAVLGLIYLLKLVMVTTLTSVLLAFMLEPIVAGLGRLRFPRPLGALIAVLVLLVVAGAASYFFYSRAVDFANQLPRYSGRIRATLGNVLSQTHKIEESTKQVVKPPEKADEQPVPVEVQRSAGLSSLFSSGSGSVLEIILAVSFVPFLVYFMLTWKDHARSATVRLFPKEHRLLAHRTVSKISLMIRSFIVGNAVLGLVNAAVSITVFWFVGIPYFYFIGLISGFVTLVPYLGVFLALLPPVAGGLGTLSRVGVAVVLITVVGLHVVTLNYLYPKVVGPRVRLNPLAVTLALLFWAWIWGAMGLILAVPVVAATKIICDYIDPLRGFGAWLGE
jgi:predicted PurR-regulated permease PerM